MQSALIIGALLGFSPLPAGRQRLTGHCVMSASPPSPPERTAAEALEAANAKLEELNEVGKAPRSWADLGLPPEPDATPEVPAFLTIAPAVLGVLSVSLLLLNNAGLFGEGPDLDQWAEQFVEQANSL